MVDKLVDITQPAKADHARAVLQMSGHLRNTFHNNGVHRGPNVKIAIREMMFDLETDKAHFSSGWQHMFALMLEMVDVLDDIFATSAVKQLPVPIPDQFANDVIFKDD